MSSVPERRSYDARRRRERAEAERQATRSRVLAAAARLFAARGYTGTTMTEIAREAGVAMASVYSAGRSKADLLQAAVDRAVAGDDAEVLVHERTPVAAIAQEPDPRRQVELLAGLICEIQERSEPMQAASRQAAAVDAAVAASVAAAHLRRLESFGAILAMVPADRLRCPHAEAVDTVWAIASAEVLLLLRTVRGWSWEQIRLWLTRTLVDLLLEPSTMQP